MAWLFLFFAGLAEVIWAVAIKESFGFSRLIPSIIGLLFMLISVYLLTISMRTIPLGTAYVIWTGIGAVGAFLVGIFYYHEPATFSRVIAATLIISGLILMKITSH